MSENGPSSRLIIGSIVSTSTSFIPCPSAWCNSTFDALTEAVKLEKFVDGNEMP
jgi:hypothetical protein